ncbi:thiamine pyrophosphate-binding protein [Advenella sp. FME57]|uniref:thiamine pyrophosphate-binding protein n=1 Tax=Advenella sp. FME57 TaxID=2742604 RepID=UPI001866A6D7|nr:thiamine pyrophosphate-binding protein [Advenella sp. FME57]
MLGAHLVTDALQRAGVKTIFSLSGNQIMPIYDACIDAGIRIVHVRHEAAAVYMADAWAQLTGEIGVALVTAAPGITNCLSPVFSARLAESPILLLSGDSPISQDGMGAFQELDQTEVTKKLVKKSSRLSHAQEIDQDITSAISLALSGRPGPVHIAMPFDLLQEEVDIDKVKRGQAPARVSKPLSQADAQEIMERIARAERPLVLVGPMNNASRAPDLRKDATDVLQSPIIAMESPRGLRDPSLGHFPQVLKKADLVVLVGKTLDFTLDFGRSAGMHPEADIIVIDPDETMIERAQNLLGTRLYKHAIADSDAALRGLSDCTYPHKRDAWLQEVDRAIANRALKSPSEENATNPGPQSICQAVQKILDEAADPILISDGGEFGQWVQAFCQAPTRIINGLSGAIGGALCYAVAASIARPNATIIAMMGDGTVGFHSTEFETAARENASFIAVVGNDSRWNAEYMIQLREYGPDRLYGCTLNDSARYDLLASALGAKGAYAEQADQLEEILKKAVNNHGATCINIRMEGKAAPVF